eukprot:COSAG02_NODE_63116_length_264_cov_0.618182_1_plen_38_part_01
MLPYHPGTIDILFLRVFRLNSLGTHLRGQTRLKMGVTV